MSALSSDTTGTLTKTQSGSLRRIFSFPVMLICLLSVLATLTVRSRFNDLDMWWHLKTGEIIWNTHTIPTIDLFSYTTNHQAWIPHEWLVQLSIYVAYHLGGYSGLMLWLCFFSAALIVVGYILCWLYSGNPKTAFLGALIVWLFSTTVLAIRPQLVGYLLFTVELLLIHLGSVRNPRWLFGLPPLFALWVNCHGSFLFGLLVLGVFLVSSVFEFRIGSLVSSRWDSHRRRSLMMALLLSIAALFLNPVGAKQIFYPLNTLAHQHIVTSQIEEWQPLLLSDPRGLVLFGILGCIFLFLITQRSELSLNEMLLLVISAAFAISHQRMAVIFGICAGAIVSRLISNSYDRYDIKRDHPFPNAGLMILAVFIIYIGFPTRQYLAEQVDQGNPLEAVQFIRDSHLSGNMLNAFNYGGYLIWALPEHPDFVDGRADVFEWSGVLEEFASWATLQTDPNIILNKYDVKFCVLERQSPMAHVLPLMRNWKFVYSDDKAVIFVRSES